MKKPVLVIALIIGIVGLVLVASSALNPGSPYEALIAGDFDVSPEGGGVYPGQSYQSQNALTIAGIIMSFLGMIPGWIALFRR